MTNFQHNVFDQSDMDLQPIMWDSVLDQNVITNYNQSDFFGGVDTSGATSPSSDSVSSSPRSSSLSTSKAAPEHRHSMPEKVERRREQNRQSQRAYRDRKEKHQRELEAQIAVWKSKHETLTKSYVAQTDQISQLKAQVADLNSQLAALQAGLPDVWGQIDQSQQEFDLVPFYDRKTDTWTSNLNDS